MQARRGSINTNKLSSILEVRFKGASLMMSLFPQTNRVRDFRDAIIRYLEAMMQTQQQVKCMLRLSGEGWGVK